MIPELSKEQRKEAIQSIQLYFERNLPEPVGDLAAGLLMDFFLRDIGPLIYNRGVSDAQTRMQGKLSELDSELYEAPFTYWLNSGKRGH